MTPRQLHEALDLLLAQYIDAHRTARPSQTSVLDLLRWNKRRLDAELAAEQPKP